MSEQQASISERIVQQVAATTDQDPLQLPILHESIDPDALDKLVAGMENGEISFTYAGTNVTVTSGGEITLEMNRAHAPRIEHGICDD